MIAYLRTLLAARRLEPARGVGEPAARRARRARPPPQPRAAPFDLALHDRRRSRARVRAELHLLVRALAGGDWEEAAALRARRIPTTSGTPRASSARSRRSSPSTGGIVFDARRAPRPPHAHRRGGPRALGRGPGAARSRRRQPVGAARRGRPLARAGPGRPAGAAPAHRALSGALGRRPDTMQSPRRIRCVSCCPARRRHSRCALPLDLRAGRAERSLDCCRCCSARSPPARRVLRRRLSG